MAVLVSEVPFFLQSPFLLLVKHVTVIAGTARSPVECSQNAKSAACRGMVCVLSLYYGGGGGGGGDVVIVAVPVRDV